MSNHISLVCSWINFLHRLSSVCVKLILLPIWIYRVVGGGGETRTRPGQGGGGGDKADRRKKPYETKLHEYRDAIFDLGLY